MDENLKNAVSALRKALPTGTLSKTGKIWVSSIQDAENIMLDVIHVGESDISQESHAAGTLILHRVDSKRSKLDASRSNPKCTMTVFNPEDELLMSDAKTIDWLTAKGERVAESLLQKPFTQ